VQFSLPGGFGVTSLVEKLIVHEFVRFRHMMDTQDDRKREKEWTGGMESYFLAGNGNFTAGFALL